MSSLVNDAGWISYSQGSDGLVCSSNEIRFQTQRHRIAALIRFDVNCRFDFRAHSAAAARAAMHSHTHRCTHILTQTHRCKHTHIHRCTHTHTNSDTHKHSQNTHTNTHRHTQMHTPTHTHTHTRIHTDPHTNT